MERIKQEKTKQFVNMHIIESISLTIEKELQENPELLFEAYNYKEDEETGEYPEIYEFWSVDEWLYERLKERGEVVFECLDFYVWGRQATGQALYMDEVIQNLAEEYLK
jgi:hypothetical protein